MFDPTLVRPLFETFLGYFILGAAVILDTIGVYFIWKIVNIRV
jgi:Flp pilus assembly protein TadB